jgi:rhodanese-related sulfurtransferase
MKTADDLIKQAQAKINCLDILSAKNLYDSADNPVIIDVREAQSAEKSKLQSSVNISRGLLEMQIAKLCPSPDTFIITHCAGGGRASLSALTLQNMGYTNVHAITAKYKDIKKVFG